MFDKINTYLLIGVFLFAKFEIKRIAKTQEKNLKMCTKYTWTDVFIYDWFHRLKQNKRIVKKKKFFLKKKSPDVAGMFTSIPFI